MRSYVFQMARVAAAVFIMAFIAAATVRAQVITAGKLQIDALDRLSARASETVNVNLDEHLLRIVPKALDNSPDDRRVKEIIAGLKGVYVKNFEFDADGVYGDADLAPIRQQLRGPGWSRIVEVRSRKEGKDIEVYILSDGGRVNALAVLAFEPRQVTVVNIVGTIDLEKLSKLEGQLGVPELEIEATSKSPKK